MANTLTIMCPNKHRVVLKISPVKILQEALEEACKKQGFSPEGKGLSHHGKPLDLSLSFRLSGLPNNCNLEVIDQESTTLRAPSKTQVALQLPNGNRITIDTLNDVTLLDLVNEAERESGEQLISPPGENMCPVLQYLTQQFKGPLVLATTTLKSIGISGGRVLMRYTAKQIDVEKLREINSAVEKSQEDQRQLEAIFEKKRRENEDRKQFEVERSKVWEEDRLRRQLEADKSNSIASQMDTSSSSSSVAENPVSNANSAVPTINANKSRLERLQHVLGIVDKSLVEHTDVPFNLENNEGRIPLDSVQRPRGLDAVENGASAMEVDGAEFANFKFPEESKGKDLRSVNQAESVSVPKCERCLIVYRVDEEIGAGENESIMDELPDDFFNVTPQDVQKMQRLLKEETNALVNKALISEKVIKQRNAERKRRTWKFTVVRVLFPDKTVLQGTFQSLEKVEAVYAFVKENLENESTRHCLSLPPSVRLEKKRSENLIDAGLAPAATVIFALKETDWSNVNMLNKQLLKEMSTKSEASKIAQDSLSKNDKYTPYRPVIVSGDQGSQTGAVDYQSGGSGASGTSTAGTAKPKWLKSSKK